MSTKKSHLSLGKITGGFQNAKARLFATLPMFLVLALFSVSITSNALSFPIFGRNKLAVKSEYINKKDIKGLDLNLQIWFPKSKKPVPTIIFFTGMTGLITSKVYASFIKQMVSKGMSVITFHSSRNYPGQFKITAEESYRSYLTLKEELNKHLVKKHRGIAAELINWDQTVLMGHSSGAQPVIAFYRQALGEIKGIVLLDPVDGDPFGKTEKVIKEGEQNGFKAPLLISGTEFCKQPGYKHKWFPPCCPAGLSSEHFFAAFEGPKRYVNAVEYAHVDLLDDGFAWVANKTRFCKPSEGADKNLIKTFNAEMITDFVNNNVSQLRSDFPYLKQGQHKIKIDIFE